VQQVLACIRIALDVVKRAIQPAGSQPAIIRIHVVAQSGDVIQRRLGLFGSGAVKDRERRALITVRLVCFGRDYVA